MVDTISVTGQDPRGHGDNGAVSEEPDITDVSPTMERLWGRTARGRRGPKPALSVERIVDAALGLADTEGLAAVSMARIAETLGCSPMALYRHVASKEELLVLMADAIAADLPELPDTGTDWRAGLEAWTRVQIDMALERPWFLELPVTTAPPGPNRVRWIDRALGVLKHLDLTVDEKLQVIGLLAQHVLGEARVQVESRRAAAEQVRRRRGLPDDTPVAELDADALAAADPWADFETILVHYADPERFPETVAAFAGWEAAAPDADADLGVGFGLGIVLDGIAVFVERRTATRPPS